MKGSPIRALCQQIKRSCPQFFFLEFFLGRHNLLYRPHPILSFRSHHSGPLPLQRSVQSPIRFQRVMDSWASSRLFSNSCLFFPLVLAPNSVFRVRKTSSAGPCSFNLLDRWFLGRAGRTSPNSYGLTARSNRPSIHLDSLLLCWSGRADASHQSGGLD